MDKSEEEINRKYEAQQRRIRIVRKVLKHESYKPPRKF